MAVTSYDDIAAWYDGWVGPVTDDPYFSIVESFLGEVAGLRLCDLACGQGRVARYLADLGASVTGIDISAKLLEIAHRHEETAPRRIAYLHADARNLLDVADGAFDGVVCHLALMDIPDLAPTFRTVARILRPGGWFVFSILHPCYNTMISGEIETPEGVQRTIAGYFVEGHWRSDSRTGPPGKVGAYHRTLSAYVNTLTDAGLILERLSEIQATGEFAASRPVWAEVPSVLVARCRREVQ